MPHNYSHTLDNPIVQVRLNAMPEDGWVYDYNNEKSYTGFYHLHEDGTAMIGEGVLGVSHTIDPNKIILQTNTDDDKDPVYGCTDSTATNYDELATEDDGTCTYVSITDPKIVYGCTDSTATNYNKLATEDDGSCTYDSTIVRGCTDKTATNYDELATEDDGTCTYAPMDLHLTKTVIEVGMVATLKDGWYLADPKTDYLSLDLNNPYEGPYHLMEDGTYMAGKGVLNASHEINPNEIIIQDYSAASTGELPDDEVDLDPELDPIEGELTGTSPETIQEVREIVSDVFYKLWFEDYTLTDEQILSMQTTIRDGKKQIAGKDGRAEGEPLVFYKKDRNTLENRNDLQGEEFENICQDIFDNELSNDIIPDKFEIYEPPEESTNSPEGLIEVNTYWNLKRYIMRYTNVPTSYDVVIAEELIKYHDDLLPPIVDDTDPVESS